MDSFRLIMNCIRLYTHEVIVLPEVCSACVVDHSLVDGVSRSHVIDDEAGP